MKNVNAYIAGIIIVLFGLIPEIDFRITPSVVYWPWWIVLSAFAGFYTLFIKTSFIVRFIAIAAFISCFFTQVPFVSFTCYILLVAACYFFILCQRIKDFKPVFKMLQCMMLLVGVMFLFQCFGDDKLLNLWRSFSREGNFAFGVVGQRMQSASFSVILAAALMPVSAAHSIFPLITSTICNSAGAFLCGSLGAIAYLHKSWKKRYLIVLPGTLVIIFLSWLVISGKFAQNTADHSGRLIVWIETLKMSMEHPFVGHGLGTFKGLFTISERVPGIPWKQAHNCWIQLPLELGYPIAFVIYGYFVYLIASLARLTRRKPFKQKAFQCIAGLVMIAVNMCVHFPTRLTQTALIIVFFLAYCEGVIHHGRIKN